MTRGIRVKKEIVLRNLDNKYYLVVDPKKSQGMLVNHSAYEILSFIRSSGEVTIGEIVEFVIQKFDEVPVSLKDDIVALVDTLTEMDLLA